MITNKDVRVENGFLIINGDKYPLDGQSPEAIMQIVEDNSDTTPTENSTAPITSGGVYTALGTKQDALTFDNLPTASSDNPVKSSGVKSYVDDLIKTEYLTNNIDTIAGNTDTTVTISLNVPSGYKVIGASEVLSSSRAVAVTAFYTEQNSVLKVNCANLYSTALSNVTVGATLIYVRT